MNWTPEDIQELKRDMKAMTNAVNGFSDRLTATHLLARRVRLALIGLALLGTVLTWVMWDRSVETRERSAANHAAQVTQCQNANETREGMRNVWDFVLGYEIADPNNNPAELTMAQMILPYIHGVWAERDCSQLNKKYELPEPPALPETVPKHDTVY